MTTTRAEISQWFDEGAAQGATHMIIMCDTFDYCDYPTFITEPDPEKAKAIVDQKNQNMQQVMEVYNLSMDRDTQLRQGLAFNY